MTWFRVDDSWWSHSKVRAAGVHGRGLWIAAGSACAAEDTDGHVSALIVKDCSYFAEVNARKAVAGLVASGLWHDAETIKDCDRCSHAGPLEPGAYYFHDWLRYQLSKAGKEDTIERRHDLRKKALHRDRKLTEAIRQRDRDLCRFCGCLTSFTDRKSGRAGTYDHVDPFGDNTLTNVVVACKRCNSRKGMRTPEQAGMALLPEPPAYQPPDLTGADPDLTESNPARSEITPDPASRARHTRGGTGQVRADPGSDSGQVRADPGPRAPAHTSETIGASA